MIKKTLHELSKSFLATEDNQRAWVKYNDMTQHTGWKVHQALIVSIGNKLCEYMLTPEFTKLDKDEKDAQQRAFFIAKEIIDFLLNPLKGAEKYAAIKRHNKKIEEATKPKG